MPIKSRTLTMRMPDLGMLPKDALERLEREGAFWKPEVIDEGEFLDRFRNFEIPDEGHEGPEKSYRRATAWVEAMVGGVLQTLGLSDLAYELDVHGQTPDWTSVEAEVFVEVYARTPGSKAVKWLVDDEATTSFEDAAQNSDRHRMEGSLNKKAEKYADLCAATQRALVLAIAPLPLTMSGPEMLSATGMNGESSMLESLFSKHSHLTGLIFVENIQEDSLTITIWENASAKHGLPPALAV